MARRVVFILLSCLLLSFIAAPPAFSETERPYFLQALLGAAQFNHDSLTFNVRANGDEVEKNLSKMPFFGVIGQFPLSEGQSQFGIEWGGLLGWRSSKTSIYSTISSTQIRVKASFWLFDLFAGPYVSHTLGNNWRIYASAGPTMLFASYKEDRDTTLSTSDAENNSSDQFGVGGFVRVGVDFQMSPGAYIGICGRGVVSNLEFEDYRAEGQVSGIQGFMTFSRKF